MEDALTLIYQKRIEELIQETEDLESITDLLGDLVTSYSKIKNMSVEQGIMQLTSHIIQPLIGNILLKIHLQQTRIMKLNRILWMQ